MSGTENHKKLKFSEVSLLLSVKIFSEKTEQKCFDLMLFCKQFQSIVNLIMSFRRNQITMQLQYLLIVE